MTPKPGTPQARKNALRTEFLAAREARTVEDAGLRNTALLAYLEDIGAQAVALYVSFGTEPDTTQLRAALRAQQVTVLLPILEPSGALTFALDTGSTTAGLRGIAVPTGEQTPLDTADVIVVPALAVDRTGVRLGRGGGSYDRALGARATSAPVIAMLHPGEFVEGLPAEPHDVRVDAFADPTGITWITRSTSR
jgi:5-formyltetrahydrofolate cyclo-ligase